MKICFIDFFTEAALERERGEQIASALRLHGHDVVPEIEANCDVVLCGSLLRMKSAKEAIANRDIFLVNYNWDLYSRIVHGKDRALWREYGAFLKASQLIWCPSQCTVVRTRNYYKVASEVLKTCVWTWHAAISHGDYVFNPMRRYPDINANAVQKACRALGIPCLSPNHRLSFSEYKDAVGGCRFMASGYYEASTASLSLLEGYCLGKSALISNSPWNGGIDYLGSRGIYFNWKSSGDLRKKLRAIYDDVPALDPEACRSWVEQEYSVARMAKEMDASLRRAMQ